MKNKDIYQQVWLDVWDKTTNSNNLWRQINDRFNPEILDQFHVQNFQVYNQVCGQVCAQVLSQVSNLIKAQMYEK